MRKILIFFLSVMMILISVTGCGKKSSGTKEAESTVEEVTKTEAVAENETTENTETKDTSVTEVENDTEPEDAVVTENTQNAGDGSGDFSADSNAGQASGQNNANASGGGNSNQNTKDTVQNDNSGKEGAEQSKQPATEAPATPPVEEPVVTVAAYDPNQVCSLAIAKCQAGGMITTEDNLANALAEGRITQEEYNEYYPLDGMEGSYYSVFVETDLNAASDIAGNKLGSVEGIADYIAGMMLLETEPVFNIKCVGTYNLNGTEFYEFRCYR